MTMPTAAIPGRLLLLGCSARKRTGAGPLPALALYDGPQFRLVRRYLAGRPEQPPAVHVLSAEHGLLRADQPLAPYDRHMTAFRARQIRSDVTSALERLLEEVPCQEVLAPLGRVYLASIDLERLTGRCDARWSTLRGTPGGKLNALYSWLHGTPPQPPGKPRGGEPWLRGVPVPHDAGSAVAAARRALASGELPGSSPESWYVQVDDARLPVKWLAALLSGLGPDRFHTHDACRLLVQLGLQVRAVASPPSPLLGGGTR